MKHQRSAFQTCRAHKFIAQKMKIASGDPAKRRLEIGTEIESSADLGVPLGGIGTGGMAWSRTGRFGRWTLKPGTFKYFTEPSCGFALMTHRENAGAHAQALQSPPADEKLSSFNWISEDDPGEYSALFPKALRRHDLTQTLGVTATCESFSPILPHNIETASLPVAIFNWSVCNTTSEPLDLSMMMHWANMNHWFNEMNDARPFRHNAGNYNRAASTPNAEAIIFETLDTWDAAPPEGAGQMAIALQKDDGLTLSSQSTFDGNGDGSDIWQDFSTTGMLQPSGDWLADANFRSEERGLPAGAVAAKATLAPGEVRQFNFSLAWDFPVFTFGAGRSWRRWHTVKWGANGKNALELAGHGISNASVWSQQIDDFHSNAENLFGEGPDRAGFALNELYLLVDGATVLTAPDEIGRSHFAILECPDYPYYNTLDLYVYAAEAILAFWPEAEKMALQDFTHAVSEENTRQRKAIFRSDTFPLKVENALPHDLGAPEEDPFYLHNGYAYQDSTRWKDLNSHYVLSVWRAGERFGGDWRTMQYAAVKQAIARLETYDRDGDGLIENEGYPDQTFDSIPMTGPSSYCGGLWMAALAAASRMAAEAGEDKQSRLWLDRLTRAKQSFEEKLWAGSHYRVDTCGPTSDAYFIEQLFGPFLARRYGLGNIIPTARARTALKTLHQKNFIEGGQRQGASLLTGVSAAAKDDVAGHADPNVQVGEILVGITLSFCAQLREWGLDDEADQVRSAIYRELYEDRGLFFRTPAALDVGLPVYRAPMNLRPLAIWMMADWNKLVAKL